MKQTSPRGWYSRGYLPHFDGGEITQFLTYRLADSMPQSVLRRFELEVEQNLITDREKLIKIDQYLDQGVGECYLKNPKVAAIVEENILRWADVKYKLFAWVIMPNHIHLLLRPLEGWSLSKIAHTLKSYTASKANKILNRKGRFWFPEPFDRYIRDYEHFEKAFNYIENNPVKAGLCEKASDWRFSSAWKGAQAAVPARED